MAYIRTMLKVTLILGFVIILLSVFDFLALHDIHKDYVSQETLSAFKISVSNLPSYTQTNQEWMMISFSFYSKFLFLILNSIVLVLGLKYFNQKPFTSGV